MAKAVQITETGGPEVLRVTEVPDPQAGPGELLVDVAAAGVNYVDTYHRDGTYPVQLPLVLGVEGAGTVRAVGADVTGFAAGDRVAWAMAPGSYASVAAIPQTHAVKVPEGVGDDVAAAIALQGMTAHMLTRSVYPIADGDTVLVHAAAGGVGLLLVQLAKTRGARVLATGSTEQKRELARGAGADEVFGYEGFADRVKELTDGAGVHAVYDGVGATTFDDSLASLRVRGTMALFGAASGPVPPVDPQRLNRGGSLYLTRPTLAHFMTTREELDWRAGELFEAVAAGSLNVRIGHTYPLDEAAQAHADLQGRKTTGKLLLIP
ncbi:quinone oxidoreductase family protein [Labedaea rhizosphaerae]|uniref:NADPH2:quinone reductase n=1 Tax=Labedaea rhizosphaerae TaxID=598644 RepID=A0A4R6RY98_LABRH|nr:quinone oxidoreductase [Labedaea rhizosphaerae]TDP92109.1 NADPH2:quinone reductase [Labedaea rhizosphaerae]